MRARAIGGHDLAVTVEVARVEELQVLITQLAARRDVPRDIVQLAQAAGEGDVRVVGKTCVAEDGETVLGTD